MSATVRPLGDGLAVGKMKIEDKTEKIVDSVPMPEEAKDKKSDFSGSLQGFYTIFFALLGPFWSAFVFLHLWRWFILPLGIRDITFWHSLGLVTLGQFLLLSVYPWQDDKQKESSENWKPKWNYWRYRLWRGNLIEAVYFLIGWLAHYGVRHIP